MTPEKIGRYIVSSELGRGGMATVYHAKDPYFDRDVAVKVLPRTFLHDPQFRVRFEREAKTIAALEHSAIVPVYDFGEDDGQPFIIMRLMSGGSLDDKLKLGKLSLEESVRIVTQLAPGLDAAHKSGIIHRDLKPGNILFDQYNNAFLSDFGIARLTEGESTLTGSRILGTPAYMSPEQIQGGQSLDSRSDIYAMGVIFYQMLVGTTPFQATTPAKVMMMHILEPVPTFLKSLPTVPRSIETWLERILAKEPDDRFNDAIEMAQSLEAAMRGDVLPPTPSKETVVVPAWSDDTTKQARPIPVHPPLQQEPQVQPQPQFQAELPSEIFTPQAPTKKRKRLYPVIIGAGILLAIGAIATIYLIFSGLNGNGPLAMLGPATATSPATMAEVFTDTPEPSFTQTDVEDDQPVIIDASPTPVEIPPTATETPPIPTPEPSATAIPEILSIGGADKIAFLNSNDIWLMNVDGSDLQQMTNDSSAITYLSGKCVFYVEIESTRIDAIACFESAEYLETFSISPDGTQVAISLNRELYIVPFDLERLKNARFNYDLKAMGECESLSPILTANNTAVPIKLLRWSSDSQRIIILKLANVDGQLADLIQVFELQSCDFDPIRTDEIPAFRFTLEGYDKTPYIQNFGFDGDFLISLVSYTRNDGHGHLYIYNTNLHRADIKVNPINGNCCYRDPQFSPDGRYLILVYQPYDVNAKSQLYYIPFGTIGTGATYEPLPLPEYFFENAKEKPQPVLRPSQ
jgi:serine/threonine-protein kinase